jgi:UDP-N-acetylglucosamine--N-acetylmuramyl-(pentapeptide) pyrophosphoryl-undecaprenol N-acetylglucosamine transferase
MPEHIKKRVKIIQQVRKEDIDKVQGKYIQNKIDCEISVFFNNIFTKFKLAHLVITRAGGSTVAEIIASKKPAILVPLSNSLDNHQLENALYIKNSGGWIFDEGKNKISELKKLINNLFINPHKLIEANKKLNKLSNKLTKLLNNKTSTDFLTDLIIKKDFDTNEEVTKPC